MSNQDMKNYFLSHLPKRNCNKKFTFPFQIFTFPLNVWGHCKPQRRYLVPHENTILYLYIWNSDLNKIVNQLETDISDNRKVLQRAATDLLHFPGGKYLSACHFPVFFFFTFPGKREMGIFMQCKFLWQGWVVVNNFVLFFLKITTLLPLKNSVDVYV